MKIRGKAKNFHAETTLARMALAAYPRVAYLDLKNSTDAATLQDALAYLALYPDTSICPD